MKHKEIIAIVCMFLIISLPISLAQQTQNKNNAEDNNQDNKEASATVGAGEINVGYIGPETKEEFKEDTFYSDITINVNRYEPTVLTTNLVEEQDTPIYAFLSALPSIDLGEVPRISSVDVAVIGGDTQYVARKPQYFPPPVYTYEDIGYIATWIKRIPKEQDVPRKIDLDLKARIRFEGEVTAPVLGGEQKKIFSSTASRRIFSGDRFIDPEFSVFGGRGYLRPSFIGKDFAVFDVYGHDGVRIGQMRATIGQESESISLVPGSKFVEDQVRVRVERIIDESQTSVNLEIEGVQQTYNVGNEIGLSTWFVEDIFVPDDKDTSASFVYLVKKEGNIIERTTRTVERITSGASTENELILILKDGKSLTEEETLKWYEAIYFLSDDARTRRNLLNDPEKILNSDLKQQLGINSQQAGRFLSRKIPALENELSPQDFVKESIGELKAGLDNKEEEDEFPIIISTNKGFDLGANLRIRGSNRIFHEGDELTDSPFNSCTDPRTNKEIFCTIETITDNSVTISYPRINNQDECIGTARETLYINTLFSQEQQTRTIPREQGSQDIPPSTTLNTRESILGSERCGAAIELIDIESNKQVEVTILSGLKRGYTESLIKLHVPIEKRAINISIDELDKKIEETQKLIEDLDHLIEKLEKFVSTWSKVCLGVSAWFTLEAFLVGLPKYKKGTSDRETFYNKEFQSAPSQDAETYYTIEPKEDQPLSVNSQIFGIENGMFYGQKEGARIPLENQQYVYNTKREQLVWDPKTGELVPAPKLSGSDERSIRVYSGQGGKDKIVIGVDDKDKAIKLVQSLGNRQLSQELENALRGYSNQGFYFVYDQGESVTLFQKRGNIMDFQERGASGELDDVAVPFFAFKTGGSSQERFFYDKFEQQLGRVREAQIRGQRRAFFAGSTFDINDMGKLNTAKYRCEDVLGSEAKCSILYNACDPVVCPRSRCNLGGQYQQTGPSGVIGSGLVGSLVLCLPNIHPDNGGVLVPICLSGILASLKGIRSHLQTYKQCLEKQKVDGVVEGTCDKLRSIFLCQLIWREVLVLLQAKAGLINLFNSQGAGGGEEYFTQGIGGSIEEANEVVGFMVNDYADDVLAAYRGKGLAEIGVEVCKASIAQRIPFLDALVQEFATPANPPQFTAYFEEAPYAPTLGKSLYSVYLHIYAGTPQREGQTMNYFVYLKSFGSSPRLVVDSGNLGSEQSADKNIDLIGDAGYQEICTVINGLEQCGFGRVVSSSFLISGLDDYLASIDLAREIKTAAQCKAEPTAPITYTLQTGALPFARVRRVCSSSNPGLGLGEENSWKRVGSCGQNEQGISLGLCWEFGDLSRYPELEKQALDLSCNGGEICESTQECKGHRLREDSRGRVCCVPKGSCEDIEAFTTARESIGSSGLDSREINKLVNDFKKGVVTTTTRLTPEESFELGLHACSTNEIAKCEEFFFNIPASHKLYAKANLVLGIIYLELNELEKAKSALEKAQRNKKDLSTQEQKDLEEKLAAVKVKLEEKQKTKEEKSKVASLKDTANKILREAISLKNSYSSFASVRTELEKSISNLTTITNTIGSTKEQKDEIVIQNLNDALTTITNINIEEDQEYKRIIDSINKIKEDLNQNKIKDEIRTTIKAVKDRISSSLRDLTTPRKEIISILDSVYNGLQTQTNELLIQELDGIQNKMPQLKEPLASLKEKIETLKTRY